MPAKTEPAAWEHALVRHVVPARRNEIWGICDLLRTPFPAGSSTTSGPGYQDLSGLGCRIEGPWMIAARLARQSWAVLHSNVASATELFEANARSRRLEVALLGCRLEGIGWFFRLHRARKPVVEYTQSLADDSVPVLHSAEIEPGSLDDCRTGEEAFQRLCARFDISLPLPQIRETEQEFQVIGRRGKPVKTALRGYHVTFADREKV